jgi:biofilm PGA synthesis N-glycosyltransferase PgaC
MRLIAISPCRDEAAFAQRTLDSVAAQTVRPDLWVIVDDGSTDGTSAMLDAFAAVHPWVRVVHRADRGRRAVGPGVIDAFYAGYDEVRQQPHEFLCKLDLDLELPPRYFEILLARMAAEPRLGTCSGKPWFRDRRGRLVSEGCGDENSVGMTKLYRTACFNDIGGFVRAVMWDGIDGHRCRMAGWIARSWDEPELRFHHLRPMGSSQVSWWTGRVRHGGGQWFMGTGALYMLASCAFRLLHPPVVVGSIGMLWGYLRGALLRQPRYAEPGFRSYLRNWQRWSLLLGKRRATARCERTGAASWKPPQA